MKGPHPLIKSRAGLLSILFIYAFIIFLILFFSKQIMNDLSTDDIPSRFIILPFAVVLPIFLAGNILVNIIKVLRDIKKKKPGATFKVKLIIFFTFVSIVSAAPQAFLSISFIDTVMKSWLNKDHSGSVKGGLEIAINYYSERAKALEAVTASSFFRFAGRFIPSDSPQAWKMFKESYPFLSSMQIIKNGKTLYFEGDYQGRIDESKVISGSRGLLPKDTSEGATILRSQGSYRDASGNYSVIFSSILPYDFDLKAENLTSSYDILLQLENYQSMFRIIVIAVLMFFSLPIFLLTIIISFRLAEEIIYPIVQLEDATRRVTEGDFSFRLLARPGDNISVLIKSFNQMIQELEASRKKNMQSDKINAWKEIARRMAHEIKNPLTPIKLSAERILKRYNAQDPNLNKIIESSIKVIVTEVDRLNHLLQEFSDFARMPQIMFLPENPLSVIKEAIEIFSTSSSSVTFEIHSTNEDSVIMMDREKIKQVLINLFTNAIEAMDNKGTVHIRSDNIIKENRKFYRIQIADSGRGIDKEVAAQIFQPYFTTRENGTGLGLAIVERIIFDHNGSIWLETEKDSGTIFFIDLPFGDIDEQNSGS